MPKSVFIACPSGDGKFFHNTTSSLVNLASHLTQEGWDFSFAVLPGNSLIDQARNLLLKSFLDSKCEDLLWIDADVGFDSAEVIRLLERPEKVVGGCYPAKVEDEERYPVKLVEPHNWNGDLVEAMYLPGGMIRVKRSVFQDLIERYRDDLECLYTFGDNEIDVMHMYRTGQSENGGYCGEDVSFSNALRTTGYKLWLDPNMNLTHAGLKVWEGNYKQYLEAKHGTPA